MFVRTEPAMRGLYMKTKRSERESEQLGRNIGVIGPWKYVGRDAWVYRWEDLDKCDQRYRWEFARERPNTKQSWEEIIGYPFWVMCPEKRILGVCQDDNEGVK